MIQQAFEKFGKNSFQHAIFYSNKNCLRFELSEGAIHDSHISMFTTALQRSTEIIETVFEKNDELSVCFSFAGDSFLSNLSQFHELQKLGFEFPKERYIHSEWDEEDEWHRNYVFFKIAKTELHKLLFGKMGNELGIRPSFWLDVYIFDLDLGVLAHPYDDRGIDLVGSNKLVLSRIYKQFNSWLLEYDIAIMKQWFGDL
ncbi:DUF3885 domain-containing protein [Pseudoalteromonas luteoviolacea]|uniref:DUF3885 domain-containing protein n=1 Tax=Pseudoalteromonas luteoviolacea TaxID=43657 RepID=UPI001F3E6775|nr:DUF3885 domain-containing protein [Pseudoalteromonas luteoviolacea]MCF6442932.1 DUF3885 domain-containing protein [Pseudoalteromonas luteoviolacea]